MSDNKPQTSELKHPLQPIGWDKNGVIRFKPNAIVNYILDEGGIDLNHIAVRGFSDDDRTQFAQLIGYSVSGGAGLSYFDPMKRLEADAIADALYEGKDSPENIDPKDAIIDGLRKELASLRHALNLQLGHLLQCTPDEVSEYVEF